VSAKGTCSRAKALQIADSLPQDAASIAAMASQLVSLALERAAASHAAEVNALQGALTDREAQVAELEQRCNALVQEHESLAQVRHPTAAVLTGAAVRYARQSGSARDSGRMSERCVTPDRPRHAGARTG
jgi:hypothetical protein